jgi:hypothetical protein
MSNKNVMRQSLARSECLPAGLVPRDRMPPPWHEIEAAINRDAKIYGHNGVKRERQIQGRQGGEERERETHTQKGRGGGGGGKF